MNKEDIKKKEEHEDDYIEEEDSDYDPNAIINQDSEFSESDNDNETIQNNKKRNFSKNEEKDTEIEVKRANYNSIENSEGGLIKTRSQRLQEDKLGKQFNINTLTLQTNTNINELWESLKSISNQRLKIKYSSNNIISSNNNSNQLNSKNLIKIKRSYEYAGEIITEEKWVNRDSAEAKAYINGLQNPLDLETNNSNNDNNDNNDNDNDNKNPNVNERGEKLRRIKKRKPLLEGIINGSIKPKFNTLEKSRVDFAKFVDKEGINDELIHHNKDGYLSKQDFLSRVEFHKDQTIKEIRKKELNNKQNE
ncbi:hypothetical protein WICMUC_001978 [Wickerhamomyces mucosus]|uniref:SWR1-complex protein 5 n=1 Tax=Wickerhamomyces mucosus TaxID=1378264 RepID=A0A9P8PR31_9ASCO|nr:hypothetical protein WICMUC_001978 [Wickerhamomyces mucosus]